MTLRLIDADELNWLLCEEYIPISEYGTIMTPTGEAIYNGAIDRARSLLRECKTIETAKGDTNDGHEQG